jgi:hypothetical protein
MFGNSQLLEEINGTADCVVDVDPLGTEKLDTYPKVSHSDFVTDAVTQAY